MPTQKMKPSSRKIKYIPVSRRVAITKSLTNSRRIQLLFVVVFACIGAYLLFNTHAAAPTVPIVCPFDGRPSISSGYGVSRPGHTHAGIDIPVPGNTPMYASQDGTLSGQLENNGGYGHYVDLVNGTYRFRYGHITKVAHGAGAVKAGDLIAYSGNSGDSPTYHLHYEIHNPNTGGADAFGTKTTMDPAPSYAACSQRGSNNPSPSGGGTQTNNVPKGSFDGVNCDAVYGWAFDPDNSSASINVHVYFDAEAGQAGSQAFGTTANLASADVNNAYGISGNHRFSYAVPSQFKDGQSHAVITYAIDSAGGTNTKLGYKSVQCASSTPAPTTPPPATSTAKPITGVASGRCLDAINGGTSNGTRIQIYDCNGTNAQKWTRNSDGTIVGAGSGRCLDGDANNNANGAIVQLWDCNGSNQQKWNVNSNGSVCNRLSGRCLDAAGPSNNNGTIIQLWDYLGGANQQWRT